MDLAAAIEYIPLRKDSDGVIRVGGSRVTLDTVITAFQGGTTPEEIAHQYPVLSLAEVYGVIAIYLRRQDEVDTYLLENRSEAQATAEAHADLRPAPGLRERLLARRKH